MILTGETEVLGGGNPSATLSNKNPACQPEPLFNPFNLSYTLYEFSSYLTENSVYFHFKDQTNGVFVTSYGTQYSLPPLPPR